MATAAPQPRDAWRTQDTPAAYERAKANGRSRWSTRTHQWLTPAEQTEEDRVAAIAWTERRRQFEMLDCSHRYVAWEGEVLA